MSASPTPLFCDRCATELVPGKGDFYVVHIEAVADPSPPAFDEHDLARDPRKEMARLIEEAAQYSPQELRDQVHRRVTIYLCRRCYDEWIENPVS